MWLTVIHVQEPVSYPATTNNTLPQGWYLREYRGNQGEVFPVLDRRCRYAAVGLTTLTVLISFSLLDTGTISKPYTITLTGNSANVHMWTTLDWARAGSVCV